MTKALETRKPPKLSSSQLETLTIIAYYQPATKAMVEQIRGVDSAYSVAALLNKKLIEEAGPLLYYRRDRTDALCMVAVHAFAGDGAGRVETETLRVL